MCYWRAILGKDRVKNPPLGAPLDTKQELNLETGLRIWATSGVLLRNRVHPFKPDSDWVMSPLLIHASSKSQSDRPRRVLHIEYSASMIERQKREGPDWARVVIRARSAPRPRLIGVDLVCWWHHQRSKCPALLRRPVRTEPLFPAAYLSRPRAFSKSAHLRRRFQSGIRLFR